MADEEPKGIRAEMRIGSPSDCPIAKVSGRNGASSLSVSKAESSRSSEVTEEVVFDSEKIDEAETCGEVGDETMQGIFSYGSETVYRFSREKGRGCACERVEDFGFPVVDIHTEDGDLFLTFHVTDNETLKRVMERLGQRRCTPRRNTSRGWNRSRTPHVTYPVSMNWSHSMIDA